MKKLYYKNILWLWFVEWDNPIIPAFSEYASEEEYVTYIDNIKSTLEAQKRLLEEKKAKLVESLKSGDFSTVADLLLG